MSQTVLPFVVEVIVQASSLLGKDMAVNMLMVSRCGCVFLCPDSMLSQLRKILFSEQSQIFLG